jgi:hypothetical protein
MDLNQCICSETVQTANYCPAKIKGCPYENPECAGRECELNFLPPEEKVEG